MRYRSWDSWVSHCLPIVKRGYDWLLPFCDEHGINYEITGKVIVATRQQDVPVLDRILEKGRANGLTGISLIGAEATREKEPHVKAVSSIWVPQSGIVDYAEVARNYQELLEAEGHDLLLNNKVEAIDSRENEITVISSKAEINCHLVINCAGLYSDVIAKMTMPEVDIKILPFQ